jgi:hypothetical protein
MTFCVRKIAFSSYSDTFIYVIQTRSLLAIKYSAIVRELAWLFRSTVLTITTTLCEHSSKYGTKWKLVSTCLVNISQNVGPNEIQCVHVAYWTLLKMYDQMKTGVYMPDEQFHQNVRPNENWCIHTCVMNILSKCGTKWELCTLFPIVD